MGIILGALILGLLCCIRHIIFLAFRAGKLNFCAHHGELLLLNDSQNCIQFLVKKQFPIVILQIRRGDRDNLGIIVPIFT